MLCVRSHTLLGLLALTVSAAPASANLLVNGSFESPAVGPTGLATISAGNAPGGFGWMVEAGNVEVIGELYPPLPGPSFDGVQHLDINGVQVGTLSQGFATTAGTDYDIQFVYASNYVHHDTTNPALATVSVVDFDTGADVTTPFVISHGTASASDLDWTLASLTITAIGPTTSLRFVSDSLDTPFGGILLDAVVVVPEPSTATLLMLGLGGLAAHRSRSRLS